VGLSLPWLVVHRLHELPHVRRLQDHCEPKNASSALSHVLLRQLARHAASCRRRQPRLSLPSLVSSLKLSEVASCACVCVCVCGVCVCVEHMMHATRGKMQVMPRDTCTRPRALQGASPAAERRKPGT
jgi:hypothetical protein